MVYCVRRRKFTRRLWRMETREFKSPPSIITHQLLVFLNITVHIPYMQLNTLYLKPLDFCILPMNSFLTPLNSLSVYSRKGFILSSKSLFLLNGFFFLLSKFVFFLNGLYFLLDGKIFLSCFLRYIHLHMKKYLYRYTPKPHSTVINCNGIVIIVYE